MLGVQGAGKSLCAKAVATAWGQPLLRLDPGTLYNGFIGESEANLRRALRQTEAMAPVILWIDEIEKELDRLTLEFIVRQQPVARHLRFAYAAIKVNAISSAPPVTRPDFVFIRTLVDSEVGGRRPAGAERRRPEEDLLRPS